MQTPLDDQGPAIRHVDRAFDWHTARLSPTLLVCPQCGVPIAHLLRQDTGEFWYFHGPTPDCASLVLSEVQARTAMQATNRFRTVPGQVAHFCEVVHTFPDARTRVLQHRLDHMTEAERREDRP